MPISHCADPTLIISLGDPSGIGPEVIVKSLAQKKIRRLANYVIAGDGCVLEYYNRIFKSGLKIIPLPRGGISGKSGSAGGIYLSETGRLRAFKGPAKKRPASPEASAALAYLDRAIELTRAIKPSALVTAPVCKESIEKHSREFHGHTDYLAKATQSKKALMCFVGPKLKIALFTHHIPLALVPRRMVRRDLEEFLNILIAEIKEKFSLRRPKIAVAGLNPHAGENGLLGREEKDIIIPAMRSVGGSLTGPVPADVLFYNAYRGEYDFVVALYHDQALGPFKMVCRENGVNLTLGLPFIRTSPDHGTAFDIAGEGRADPRSFQEALLLALQLTRRNADGSQKKR